ncbi:MAG: DUF4837 family protein [Ignavibacteria bacterium]|jgi:uncharacterized protein YqgQ|nr:DUF4837 family protein [Ignavibacteria bacterium]MCU7502812.1 DUF4837 family protein [Ignavibacteria bacterium]MCU7517908.1 DUF4837 family protein [Ignavibacteria bacterium]
MKKIVLLFSALAVIVSLNSCSRGKPAAKGPDDRIYVIADSAEFESLRAAVDSVFGKIIYTPQPEKTFELVRRDFSELDKLKESRNIIVIAPLNSTSNVANYVNQILDENVKNGVRAGRDFVFNKYNLWAEDQLVMILTSADVSLLKAKLRQNSASLLEMFRKASVKKLFNSLYMDKYENKELEAKFLREYGWVIYVQKDFQLVLDKPKDRFVWLRSLEGNDMARWIFVHWIDNASPDFLNADSITKERNRLTEKYLKPAGAGNYVKMTDEYKTTSEVNFHNKYALLTQGLWEMSDKSMGGPFVNYTLFDDKTKRIYMLDGSIYAPKYLKKNLIRQLDVLLQSFMTEKEMDPRKKAELLK